MHTIVDRYSLNKEFIIKGELMIEQEGALTILTYFDSSIKISATGLYHPITALDNLRQQLEIDYHSILAINGCRVDTAHRATGSYMTYILEYGKSATYLISMFEPTEAIDKLTNVEAHKIAYKTWCKSMGLDGSNSIIMPV